MKSRGLPSAPGPAALRAVDEAARRIAPDDEALRAWHSAYVPKQRTRLAHDLELVAAYVPKGSAVLEIGAVPLVLTAALTRGGFHVTGCDIAPERYAGAITRLGLDVVKCNVEAERLPFAESTFDAVVCNEIFEHLRIDLVSTLGEVLRVLKPGGTLMLSSPNLRSLGGIRNFLFRNRAYSCAGDLYAEYRKLATLGHMGHVREYTTTEVTEFLEHIGFSVDELIYRGGYTNALARALTGLAPALRPFVSYIARRPAR